MRLSAFDGSALYQQYVTEGVQNLNRELKDFIENIWGKWFFFNTRRLESEGDQEIRHAHDR